MPGVKAPGIFRVPLASPIGKGRAAPSYGSVWFLTFKACQPMVDRVQGGGWLPKSQVYGILWAKKSKEDDVMEDITMGQRIAGERKKLGLSQEALGEKMGVSRQAISKWEADGAVPEIDKLIALSRLFGVSLNWLLGVDESAAVEIPQPEASEPETAFAFRFPSLPRWVLRLGGAVLLTVVALWLVFQTIRSANFSSGEYQRQIDYLNSRINTLESRIAALELEHSSDASSGALLADYSFDVKQIPDTFQASVIFNAMPHGCQAGDQAYLYILPPKAATGYLIDGKYTGLETMAVPCIWDGASLTAAAVLDFSDGYSLCFTVEHSDGSRQMQLLSHTVLENLHTAFVPTLSGSVGSATYLTKENALELKDLYVSYHRPDYGFDEPVRWKRVSVILTTDGEEVARRDVLHNPGDSTADSGGGSWRIISHKLSLNGHIPETGQAYSLSLYAEMSNGVQNSVHICSFTAAKDGSWQIS